MSRELGLGVIGAGWMGHVHARAASRLSHHFPELPQVQVVAVAEPVQTGADDFVRRHHVQRTSGDWREVVGDPAVDIVSVAAPNAMHREIALAVAAAGKHLWIEKPVGLSAQEARDIEDAMADAPGLDLVGFNYRNVPAVTKARGLIESGAIGSITHARVSLLTDYAAHPGGVLSWRFEREQGGYGVLADLACHGVDLIRYLLGDVSELVADTAIFIGERPIPSGAGSHYAVMEVGPETPMGQVHNEDYVAAMMRMESSARAFLESGRTEVGQQNAYTVEVHGLSGMLRWDFRRSDELELSTGAEYSAQPTTTLFAGPGDGDYANFHPGAGIAMSYDDTKVIELANLLRDLGDGGHRRATVTDAVRAAEAVEAMIESAASGRWVSLPHERLG